MYTHHDFHHPSMSYGFFSRQGGVSKGVYKGLNCGFGSNDKPEDIEDNRKRVADKIGVEIENLLGPYQVHSNKVVKVTEPFVDRPNADALVTDKPNLALSVLTADCAPVLFFADGVIGAAHAGWKGALSGVLDDTISSMKELGANEISACIGPCIGPEFYEVSEEFKEKFLQDSLESTRFFSEDNYFNLPEYCMWRLKNSGLENIHVIKKDTYKHEEEFFSYRRTTHRGESDYGRQISAIMLKS